jgi:hypothetical protein
MKKHNFWTILLLISFSFSIAHAFVIESNEVSHCTIQEYVQEFSQSNDCGDLCDIRHMFHISFILPDNSLIIQFDNPLIPYPYFHQDYTGDFAFSSLRPPIAV